MNAMAGPPSPGAIPDRVRLVIALTEVNSRHLRSETRRAGAEIELERALEDQRAGGDSQLLVQRIAELQSRLALAQREARDIETEREWLEQALTHIDDEPPPHGEPGEVRQ